MATFRAGMGYLFLRGKEKCSRLRGNWVPNQPRMLRSNVLRGNWGIFFPGRGCLVVVVILYGRRILSRVQEYILLRPRRVFGRDNIYI